MGAARAASVLAAAALLAACAAGCATPIRDGALERRLRFVGYSVLGPTARFSVVPVSADSPMMAWTLIASSRADGPSSDAKALRHKLRAGAAGPARIVVGGPFPHLTEQVVLDAFELNRGGALPGLTLVVVGGEDPPSQVVAEARRLGARVFHRQLP